MALTRDIGAIAAILNQDRVWSAYATCDLEEPAFGDCEWHINGETLVLVYHGLDIPLVVPFGRTDGLEPLLRDAVRGVDRFLINFRADQSGPVHATCEVLRSHPVWRMELTSFASADGHTIPLAMDRLDDLLRLYRLGGGPIFSPGHLALGYFHGMERDGQLVAAAGIHSVSRRYSVAAVGSVATDPRYRGLGFAKACTSAVVRDLRRDGITTIILNADADNQPAVRAYERIGFSRSIPYEDGLAEPRP